jgi:hypothetical protein
VLTMGIELILGAIRASFTDAVRAESKYIHLSTLIVVAASTAAAVAYGIVTLLEAKGWTVLPTVPVIDCFFFGSTTIPCTFGTILVAPG